jgi:hypothetical protein
MFKDASYLVDFEKDKIPEFHDNSVCRVNEMKVIPEYKINFSIE